jgi:hypothetical protein
VKALTKEFIRVITARALLTREHKSTHCKKARGHKTTYRESAKLA